MLKNIIFWLILLLIIGLIIGSIQYVKYYNLYNNEFIRNLELNEKINNQKFDLENSVLKYINFNEEIEIMIKFIKATNNTCDPVIAKLIAESIVNNSKKYNVFYGLILGIIKVESTFNPFSVSKIGARGLMQVNHKVHNSFDVYRLHEINYGIEAGVLVYKEIFERKKDSTKALFEYVNEDWNYVDKVYRAMSQYIIFRHSILNSEEKIAIEELINDNKYLENENKEIKEEIFKKYKINKK